MQGEQLRYTVVTGTRVVIHELLDDPKQLLYNSAEDILYVHPDIYYMFIFNGGVTDEAIAWAGEHARERFKKALEKIIKKHTHNLKAQQ